MSEVDDYIAAKRRRDYGSMGFLAAFADLGALVEHWWWPLAVLLVCQAVTMFRIMSEQRRLQR